MNQMTILFNSLWWALMKDTTCFQNTRLSDFDDIDTRWPSELLSIYIYIYLYGHDMIFKLKEMLRSTTGPYVRSM